MPNHMDDMAHAMEEEFCDDLKRVYEIVGRCGKASLRWMENLYKNIYLGKHV